MSNTNTKTTRTRRAGRRVRQLPGSGRTFHHRKVTRSEVRVTFREAGSEITCVISADGPAERITLGSATVTAGADRTRAYKAAYVRALLDVEAGAE